MSRTNQEITDLEDALSSEGSFASTETGQCCISEPDCPNEHIVVVSAHSNSKKKSSSDLSGSNNYAASKNVAEGLMDIALLSANANQLRFLISYNHKASTFYYSLVLVILSLVLQVLVGLVLIFKRRLKHWSTRNYMKTNEVLVMGVFLITVINVLVAAFTTTDEHSN